MKKTKREKFMASHASFMSNSKWLKLFAIFDELRELISDIPEYVSFARIEDYSSKQINPILLPTRYSFPSLRDIANEYSKPHFRDFRSLGNGGPLELIDIWLLAIPYEKQVRTFYPGHHHDDVTMIFPRYQDFLLEINKRGQFPYQVMENYHKNIDTIQKLDTSGTERHTTFKFILFAGYEYDLSSL